MVETLKMNTPLPSTSPVKNSNLAVWSLVLGTLSLIFLVFCIGPLFAIPAVICGHAALKRIKLSGGTLAGDHLAQAGFIIGYVTLGLSVVMIPIMAGIAVPNFFKARETARKNACINNLRKIDVAKGLWALENNKTANEVPTPDDLEPYISRPASPLTGCVALRTAFTP